MTVRSNNAAGGTDTTTVTLGNSGGASGDAWGAVTIGGTGALTYSSTQTLPGRVMSYKFAPDATTAMLLDWTGLSYAQASARFYLYLTGNPSTTLDICRFGNVTTQFVGITSAGKLILDTSGGGVVWTAAAALTLNTWIRIESQMTISTTTALTAVQYYAADSATATDSFTASNGNTGSSNGTHFQLGKINASVTVNPFYISDVWLNDSATDPVGPSQLITPGQYNATRAAGTRAFSY